MLDQIPTTPTPPTPPTSSFTPFYDRYLVRPLSTSKASAGIIIPKDSEERPQEFEVVAAGRGRLLDLTGVILPLLAAVGDIVFAGKYAGTDIKIDGEELKVLREDEVLGKKLGKSAAATTQASLPFNDLPINEASLQLMKHEANVKAQMAAQAARYDYSTTGTGYDPAKNLNEIFSR